MIFTKQELQNIKKLTDSIKVKDSKAKDGIHKDWLVEHGKKLFEYCKEEDIEAVKSEAENLIKGIDNIMKSRR